MCPDGSLSPDMSGWEFVSRPVLVMFVSGRVQAVLVSGRVQAVFMAGQ